MHEINDCPHDSPATNPHGQDTPDAPVSRGTSRRLSLAVAMALALLCPACVTQTDQPIRTTGGSIPRSTATEQSKSHDQARGETGSAANGNRPFDPIDNPRGRSLSLMVRAALMPLGSIPYDGMVLPLASPDGRYLATQTGAPPQWADVLAEPEALPPYATVIEVYRLDTRETIPPESRQPPERIAQVNKAALLGRSCDAEGFLIEAPQEDGSRWIGKASWETGEIRWLAEDDAANAFAAQAPDGRLAWCRRAMNAERFDLVVRDTAGEEWTVPGTSGDWLMPVWATYGDGLYALHREAGRLRICFGIARGSRAFEASLRDFVISSSPDRYAAYQAFSGQTATDGVTSSAATQIMFFHPLVSRMAVWQPLAPRNRAATQLNASSLAALQQTADSALICLKDELILQSLKQADAQIMLSKGTWIPRRTSAWNWPYLLLSPGEDGRVLLTALRLLPRE